MYSKPFAVDDLTKYDARWTWMVIMRIPLFGGTADSDADRNMILSAQFFVSSSEFILELMLDEHCG